MRKTLLSVVAMTTVQVLKALQHPYVVAYIGHFCHDDALHVRLVLLVLCKTVTLCCML